jgi:hypothetical protein
VRRSREVHIGSGWLAQAAAADSTRNPSACFLERNLVKYRISSDFERKCRTSIQRGTGWATSWSIAVRNRKAQRSQSINVAHSTRAKDHDNTDACKPHQCSARGTHILDGVCFRVLIHANHACLPTQSSPSQAPMFAAFQSTVTSLMLGVEARLP